MSEYPTTTHERARERNKIRAQQKEIATRNSRRLGRSIKCGEYELHADQDGGCTNDGTGCLCVCHDPGFVHSLPDRFAAGIRVIGRAVAEANNATQQDFALTNDATPLGPNREGCDDPDCSRTECLHLGICWEDAFWDEGPDGEEAYGAE